MQDWRLGTLNYVIKLLILSYVVWDVILYRRYLSVVTPTGGLEGSGSF